MCWVERRQLFLGGRLVGDFQLIIIETRGKKSGCGAVPSAWNKWKPQPVTFELVNPCTPRHLGNRELTCSSPRPHAPLHCGFSPIPPPHLRHSCLLLTFLCVSCSIHSGHPPFYTRLCGTALLQGRFTCLFLASPPLISGPPQDLLHSFRITASQPLTLGCIGTPKASSNSSSLGCSCLPRTFISASPGCDCICEEYLCCALLLEQRAPASLWPLLSPRRW